MDLRMLWNQGETELYGRRSAHEAVRNWGTGEREIKPEYYIH